MLKAKIFPRGNKSFDELSDELNGFFAESGRDVPSSGIDIQDDHILAIYDDNTEIPGGSEEQVRALEATLRAEIGNYLSAETTRRFWAAEQLRAVGGTEKREAVTRALRGAEIEAEQAAEKVRIIRTLIEEAKKSPEGIEVKKR